MNYNYRIQFYADKQNVYENKLFSFAVTGIVGGFGILLSFKKHKNSFRSIYYKAIPIPENRVNEKILRLQDFENFFKTYDIDHNPTVNEAYNDYCIFIN